MSKAKGQSIEGGEELGSSCLPIGVAPIAFGLSLRFVIDDLRYAVRISKCSSIRRSLPVYCFGCEPVTLFHLQALTFETAHFPGRSNRCPFFPFGDPGGRTCDLCGTVGVDKSFPGIRCCGAPVNQVSSSRLLQIASS
jgi:hypothetical protein